MKRIAIALAAVLALSVAHAAEAKKPSTLTSTHSVHVRASKPATESVPATKSVQVKGYRTKSGKWVAPHTRTVKVKSKADQKAPAKTESK